MSNSPSEQEKGPVLLYQTEAGREVSRQIKYYNLEAIFAVGYRVRSNRDKEITPDGKAKRVTGRESLF